MTLTYIFNDNASDKIVEAVILAIKAKVQTVVTPTTPIIDEDGTENRRIILTIPDDSRTDMNTIFNLGGFIGSIEENITAACDNADRFLMLTEN